MVYYKEQVKKGHKPKIDPKKQVEIEIRRESMSLDAMELSLRVNPV